MVSIIQKFVGRGGVEMLSVLCSGPFWMFRWSCLLWFRYYYYYYYYYYSAEFVAVAVIDSFIDCFPQTPMARVMLMLFGILICALCVSKEINFTQFLLLMFSWALNLVPSCTDIIGLRVATRNLRIFPPIHVSLSLKHWPTVRSATTKISVLLRTYHDGPKGEQSYI